MSLGYFDCIETKSSPIKTAIKARILEGEHISGCRINSGDTAVCKIARAFLEAPPDDQ